MITWVLLCLGIAIAAAGVIGVSVFVGLRARARASGDYVEGDFRFWARGWWLVITGVFVALIPTAIQAFQ